MLQFITSGESHGKCLLGILEGMPSGVKIDQEFIDLQLKRRQGGYGRGGRQKIETDHADIVGGILRNESTGAPIGIIVPNKDFKINEMPDLTRPRPGHADLAGTLKYNSSIRACLERASARETAMRVAVGTIPRLMLKEFGIEVVSHVIQVGSVKHDSSKFTFDEIVKGIEGSEVGCCDPEIDAKMVQEIKRAGTARDTVGGIVEIRAKGLPIGLGTFVHHMRKLDGAIARGMMSVQAVKAVEIGMGKDVGALFGSEVHDEIFYSEEKGYYHGSNNCGGLEGSMTVGEELVVKVTKKPIATLRKALRSVDMVTKEASEAAYERSDTCAITALGVICESVLAFEVGSAFVEKFGGDSMVEMKRNYEGYLEQIKNF